MTYMHIYWNCYFRFAGSCRRPCYILRFPWMVHGFLHTNNWSNYQCGRMRYSVNSHWGVLILHDSQIWTILESSVHTLSHLIWHTNCITCSGSRIIGLGSSLYGWSRTSLNMVFGKLANFRTILLPYVLWHGHITCLLPREDQESKYTLLRYAVTRHNLLTECTLLG